MQNADPVQPFLSYVNEDWESKNNTKPFHTTELVTCPEAGSSAWWRATNLGNIQWFPQQVLSHQLVSLQNIELAHHCISLGANAVYGLFQP